MAATELPWPPGAEGQGRPQVTAERTLVAVKWWAAIGAAFMVLVAYIMIAWFVSGDATPTDPGPDPVPEWMHIAGIVMQIVSPAIGLYLVWRLVIRPWRRERTVPFDGLLLLGLASIYWQDPLVNYTAAWASYNADLLNLGSWSEQVPGWKSPNGSEFPEPILFSGFGYMWSLLAGCVAACWVMRKAKARWPRLGKLGLIMICWGFIAVVDLFMEIGFMRLGLYHYGGAIPELSIGAGNYYQFPIYEAVLWGGIWATWACTRYFRDDKGRSFVERGIDKIRVGPRRRVGLRLLALVGMMNLGTLVLYMIPWQIIATNSGPWVEDVQTRSYMRAEICGPGTGYACLTPELPIPQKGAARITPEGELVPLNP